MRVLFVFIVLLSITGILPAQTGTNTVLDNSLFEYNKPDIDTLIGVRGKSLRCNMDTLFIINRTGVEAAHGSLKRLRSTLGIVDTLDSLAQTISSLQQNLNSAFGNMSLATSFIMEYRESSKLLIDSLYSKNDSLKTITEESKVKTGELEKELRNQRKINLLWMTTAGAVGLVVGMVVGGM